MSISERFHKWKETFSANMRSLSFRGKIDYLFTYYKSWGLGLVFLIFAVFLIGDMISQGRKEIIIQGFFTNDEYNLFDAETLQNEYAEYLDVSNNQRIVFDDSLYISLEGSETEYTAASNAKIIAYMTTRELDFVVTTKAVMEYYLESIPMMDLNNVLPPELRKLLTDSLYMGIDGSGNEGIVALDMAQSRYLRDRDDVDFGKYYLFVPYNLPDTSRVAAFIEYCFCNE